ncbi:precorrin-2 C(20)-methyltransferase [Tropicimonas sediminicola]|uniref:Precorrin-2/cobalt-factor-2 C20-methyltransferase n=1 Tax=Tropicimonas sediminicola TaxID=1031541 RepID=A0A239EXA0_9RHOB|nr:precorrin-2 C(20)-methyltransferase [Tropicimonas sediminicola]SNS49235.1 precorrin-2/cobalt-factor-2 C20-methyltransferase [Tropicimonas sediminicola]
MTGTLYGLGLGPGDPELLTLKAHRLISGAQVIAYPAPDTGESFARSIAAAFIPDTAREIPIVIPMRSERFPAQEVYDSAAEEIAAALEQGQDVVVLCEGDPFFYGSFMYLYARLAERFPTEVVPGVSSLGAVTAAAGRPLIARDEVLTVLPATLPEAELEAQIRKSNAVAIMKIGRHLAKVRALLEGLGLAERAVFVSHASLPEQNVRPLREAPETAPYFSMIILPGRDAHV